MLGGVYGPIEVNKIAINSAMPGHSHLSDDDIAAAASFVRYSFGGLTEKPFPAEEVKAIRPEIEQRKFTPWTAPELRKLEAK
jgi:uncharacterized protein